jgi:hypothetical protein
MAGGMRAIASRMFVFLDHFRKFTHQDFDHASNCAVLAALLLVTGNLPIASAQTAATDAKPSRVKLSMQKACRQEVKAKGLAGDDRWFYIADCMDKT